MAAITAIINNILSMTTSFQFEILANGPHYSPFNFNLPLSITTINVNIAKIVLNLNN